VSNEPPFPGPPPGYRPTPTAPPTGRSKWPFGVSGLLLLFGIGAAIWFFGYYDTAGAKCQRGDLGACVVYYAEQSASASASAAVVSASAATVEASAQASSFAANGCTVGPGDGSHDVRTTVSDGASSNVQASTCQHLVQLGWAVAGDVPGATQVCQTVGQDGNTITVTPVGSFMEGKRAKRSTRAACRNGVPDGLRARRSDAAATARATRRIGPVNVDSEWCAGSMAFRCGRCGLQVRGSLSPWPRY
jgi:hypothetical protein